MTTRGTYVKIRNELKIKHVHIGAQQSAIPVEVMADWKPLEHNRADNCFHTLRFTLMLKVYHRNFTCQEFYILNAKINTRFLVSHCFY